MRGGASEPLLAQHAGGHGGAAPWRGDRAGPARGCGALTRPRTDDAIYYNRPLFGCFSYVVRDDPIIHPHFVKNDSIDMRPLTQPRQAARRGELRQMFSHIREHVPQARTVLGNSWMYNLAAYRRL
jgi:hypothetical protein